MHFSQIGKDELSVTISDIDHEIDFRILFESLSPNLYCDIGSSGELLFLSLTRHETLSDVYLCNSADGGFDVPKIDRIVYREDLLHPVVVIAQRLGVSLDVIQIEYDLAFLSENLGPLRCEQEWATLGWDETLIVTVNPVNDNQLMQEAIFRSNIRFDCVFSMQDSDDYDGIWASRA